MSLLIALVALSFQAAALPSASDRDLLLAVAAAYDENQALFPFGDIRFSYWSGHADSEKDAVQGRFSKSYQTTGLYVFDGDRARYDRLFSPADILEEQVKITDNQYASSLFSRRVLTNGKKTLYSAIQSEDGKTLQFTYSIRPGDQLFFQEVDMPPAGLARPLGVQKGFPHTIRAALQGQDDLRILAVEPNVHLGDQETLKIELQRSASVKISYWIDRERGCIPVKTVTESGDESRRVSVIATRGNLKKIDGHGWIPFETTSYSTPGGMAKRQVIDSANFTNRPGPDAFHIKLDKPQAVADESTALMMTLRDVIDLDNLPGPSAPNVVRINTAAYAGLGDIEPGEIQARPPYLLWGGLALSALVAATLLLRWWTHR